MCSSSPFNYGVGREETCKTLSIAVCCPASLVNEVECLGGRVPRHMADVENDDYVFQLAQSWVWPWDYLYQV